MIENITNIYCDESCHLLNDHNDIMAFGAVFLSKNKLKEMSKKISHCKKQFNCLGETKWTKVSQKNIKFYESLISIFFSDDSIGFRSLIVKDKFKLDHNQYNHGSHDSFYYKMYYYLIRNIVDNNHSTPIHVYLDIKDTKSSWKVRFLREVLANKFHDFKYEKIRKIQQIQSHESDILQLCDLMLGAVTYRNRNLATNDAKLKIIKIIEDKIGQSLLVSTPPWETKFNLFHFVPKQSA
jgi:hypothetical protein